ncbi:hypothetical protein D9M68_762080 [compost metagenome]
MGGAVHHRAAAVEEGTGKRRVALPDRLRQALLVIDHRQGGSGRIGVIADEDAARAMTGGDEGLQRMTAGKRFKVGEDPFGEACEIVMSPGRTGQHRVGHTQRFQDDAIDRDRVQLHIGLADIEHGHRTGFLVCRD